MPRRPKVPLTKKKLRSSISNGKYILSREIDQRGPLVRRLRDLVADHASDLGGFDHLSHTERMLINRTAMLTLLAEVQETSFVRQKLKCPPTELDAYLHVVGNLTRLAKVLGLRRRQRDVLSVDEYLNQQNEVEDEPAE